MIRQSDIFSSPLRGTALDRVNSQFDTISTCLDSLQTKAENSFLARGNDQADKLAKLGLEKAFTQIEELQENTDP